MKNKFIVLFSGLLLYAFLPTVAQAAFPNDFSDVIFIDPNISGWSQTSQISVNVSGSTLNVVDSKRAVWPARYHTTLRNSCCNRSLWIIIQYQGQWYAVTFEYMRFNQIGKNAEAVRGRQIKRAPFFKPGFEWYPAPGEVYGFMTSGMARFDLNNVNVRERSNVALYRWEVGPTNNINFEEVPRDSRGRPIEPGEEPGEEECVEPVAPTPVNNSHNYSGTATATITASGPLVNGTETFNEPVNIRVGDDRSVTFTIDDESFTSQVGQDDRFDGTFIFDIANAGVCLVSIAVQGTINGTNASGTASGSKACEGTTANLNGTFNATSPTAPSYLDQRAPLPVPRSTCGSPPVLSSIYDILLDD